MDNNIDNLKKLLDQLNSIGFIQRVFGWRKIRELLMEANADLQKLTLNSDGLMERISELKTANSEQAKDLDLSKASLVAQTAELGNIKATGVEQASKLSALTADLASRDTALNGHKERIVELEKSNALLTSRNEMLDAEKNRLQQQNTQLTTEEEGRQTIYKSDVAALSSIREQIQQERSAEQEERSNLEIERLKKLKETWSTHQENVKNLIKSICNKHTIEYVDKVHFKGDPDNTLKICGEYVVFDAKSPATDDLTNFPNYLKDQAEKAKKYAKQEGVKKDIFFVVPTSTLEKLNKFVFNLGDFDLFVISVDSLEQIILGLKKIEEYEFAEKLSPEDRDNICRILGKFAHLTKRRIQIDSYFTKQFIQLAYTTETELPAELMTKVLDFEKSEKLNPPMERRVKSINTKALDKETNQLKIEVEARGILIDEEKISEGLNDLQLYNTETDE